MIKLEIPVILKIRTTLANTQFSLFVCVRVCVCEYERLQFEVDAVTQEA